MCISLHIIYDCGTGLGNYLLARILLDINQVRPGAYIRAEADIVDMLYAFVAEPLEQMPPVSVEGHLNRGRDNDSQSAVYVPHESLGIIIIIARMMSTGFYALAAFYAHFRININADRAVMPDFIYICIPYRTNSDTGVTTHAVLINICNHAK